MSHYIDASRIIRENCPDTNNKDIAKVMNMMSQIDINKDAKVPQDEFREAIIKSYGQN